jgi:hypothetical protein
MSAIAIADSATIPPAIATAQHTTARITMGTSPLIESISRSLDHWQFLYILAITIALLSTFAIVIFAFHIQEHRTGLKVSNYFYVVASLLAVVATIVIVVKSKSLDAEKDRVAKIQIDSADAKAAEAGASAANAQALAVQTANENLKLQTSLANLSNGVKSAQDEMLGRIIPNPQALNEPLRNHQTVKVQIRSDMGNKETLNLQRQLTNIFVAAGIHVGSEMAYGFLSDNPLFVSGVHCHFSPDPEASDVCTTLVTYLDHHGIKADKEPFTTYDTSPVTGPPRDFSVVVYIGAKP